MKIYDNSNNDKRNSSKVSCAFFKELFIWGMIRKLRMIVLSTFFRQKDVLIYIGLHKGKSFDRVFMRYKKCYAFEANPTLFKDLQKKYEKHTNVNLINAAVASFDGEIEFNISSNDGESSSIGVFNENWDNFKKGEISMVETVKVPSINLYNFCIRMGIDKIDDYISDIQGMDLEVLKTMEKFIEKKRINTITCETTKNEKGNIYMNLPDNSLDGFKKILINNYELVATGWGVLKDGKFKDVPEDWWEMDCKWQVKK